VSPEIPYITQYPNVPRHIRVDEWTMNRDWTQVNRHYEGGVPKGWTDGQIELIGKWGNDANVSFVEMGKRLGKSVWSVRYAYDRMYPGRDAKDRKYLRTWRNKWKPEDLQFIIDNYVTYHLMTMTQIADKYGKKLRYIGKVIHKLRCEMDEAVDATM